MKFYVVGELICIVKYNGLSGYCVSQLKDPPSLDKINKTRPICKNKVITAFLHENLAKDFAIKHALYGTDPWDEGILLSARPIFTIDVDVGLLERITIKGNGAIEVPVEGVSYIAVQLYNGDKGKEPNLWLSQSLLSPIAQKYQAILHDDVEYRSAIIKAISTYDDKQVKRRNRKEVLAIQQAILSNPEISQFECFTLFSNFSNQLGRFSRQGDAAQMASVILRSLNILYTYKQALEQSFASGGIYNASLLRICLEYADKPVFDILNAADVENKKEEDVCLAHRVG